MERTTLRPTGSANESRLETCGSAAYGDIRIRHKSRSGDNEGKQLQAEEVYIRLSSSSSSSSALTKLSPLRERE